MNNNNKINSDIPAEYIEDDFLDISSFIDSLYDLINNLYPERGFVVALNGEWGAGKTSVLNFLKETNIRKSNISNFKIIDFLPWNIIDKQTLLKNFFITLQNSLTEDHKYYKIRKLINKYYFAIIEGFKCISKFSKFLNLFEKSINILFTQKEDSIIDLKNSIINYLNKTYDGKNIVIIIDDLDRLTDEEICIVLKLIKEIADFPKIIYLIAMDKEHVTNAIKNYYNYNDDIKSRKYIEKFIQIDWNIPAPNKNNIRKIFFNNIYQLIEKENPGIRNNDYYYLEKEYLNELYSECLEKEINTPRKLKLFLTQYEVLYKRIKEYVNFVDLLMILYIQLFLPDLYILIKNNHDLFTYDLEKHGKANIKTIQKDFKNMLNDQLVNISCDKKFAIKIFNTIFPNWKNSCGENTLVFPVHDYMRNMVRNKYCFEYYFGKNTNNEFTKEDLINLVRSCSSKEIIEYFNTSDEISYTKQIQHSKHVSYTKRISYSDIIAKIESLILCWNFLDKDLKQLKAILTSIFQFFNNGNSSNTWYDQIYEYVIKENNKKSYESIIPEIVEQNSINSIYKTFLYFLAKPSKQYDLPNFSDDIYHKSLNIYITRLTQYKKILPNLESYKLLKLLIQYKEFDLIQKFLNKYQKHCVVLIYLLFNDNTFRMMYLPENLLNTSTSNSENFWKLAGKGKFIFMKDFDNTIINFIRNKEYNNEIFNSILSDPLIQTINEYAKLVNLKI